MPDLARSLQDLHGDSNVSTSCWPDTQEFYQEVSEAFPDDNDRPSDESEYDLPIDYDAMHTDELMSLVGSLSAGDPQAIPVLDALYVRAFRERPPCRRCGGALDGQPGFCLKCLLEKSVEVEAIKRRVAQWIDNGGKLPTSAA